MNLPVSDKYLIEPLPDINELRKLRSEYFAKFHGDPTRLYYKYTESIAITNELYQIQLMKNLIKPDSRILTICGAGEQPLFFKSFGAKYVLAFDITYNSYLLLQLKMAAVKTFEKAEDYRDFLYNLNMRAPYLLSVPGIGKVLSNLTPIQQKYIINTQNNNLSIYLRDPSSDGYGLGQNMYNQLREQVKKTQPFALRDIRSFHQELGQFNGLYYSNACDFLGPADRLNVLRNSKQHVAKGGFVFLVSDLGHYNNTLQSCKKVFTAPDWTLDEFHPENNEVFCHIIAYHNGNAR